MTPSESANHGRSAPTRIPHDRLFKQLLGVFLFEFLELFLPDLANKIQAESIVLLDKELFPKGDQERRADLVAEVRTRQGEPATFLLHLEHEAQNAAPKEFAWRMLQYTLHLHRRTQQAVYPIALLSYSRPTRALVTSYNIHCPQFRTLSFKYRVVQLNRLDWRSYAKIENPVAAALMSRMRIEPGERPLVKLACLRTLARLALSTDKADLISVFFDAYLPLSVDEEEHFRQEFGRISEEERETMARLTTSWERKGRELERERAEQELQQIRERVEQERERAEKEREHAARERQRADLAEEELVRVKAELEALRASRIQNEIE